MKRIGNLYEKICSIDNLILAEKKARKGKTKKRDIKEFLLNKDDNIINLHHILINKEYNTSRYHIFSIRDPKERIIYKLPYYPDRIVHHAIMNILEPIFVSIFTHDIYNCIKKRGIHKAYKKLKRVLLDKKGTKYCLKLDINKFYPNINHDILKSILRKKIKDKDLLSLLYNIIDSADGVPIGNYLSQYFANLYLTYFDHWLKEELKVKYYFRYCDDIVILSDNKEYLENNLKLTIKDNYQVFPVEQRGIDFVGYKFYHDYILLRKSIKKRFINMIKYNNNYKSIMSYNGWLIYCNSINLRKKYLK